MNRRDFLLAGMVTLGVSRPAHASPSHRLPKPDDSGFSFLHYTDIHIETIRRAPQGFQQCIQHMQTTAPRARFAICGGDLVFDALQTSTESSQNLFTLFREHARTLGLPTHFVVGNHDIQSLRSQPPTGDGNAKDLFLQSTGLKSTYYSFLADGWRFVVLDSIQPDKDHEWRASVDENQLAWLKRLMITDKTIPTVVVTHVPLASTYEFMLGLMHDRRVDQSLVDNADRVIETLLIGNTKAVLQGHTHVVEQFEQRGIKFVTSGSVCGEWWRGWRLGIFAEGYAVCRCTANGTFSSKYVPYGWHAAST